MSLVTPNGDHTKNEEEAKYEAIRYFHSMLGTPPNVPYPGVFELGNIVQKRVPTDYIHILDSIPTNEEIKEAIFSIHSNKAPGPDGFNAHFFKETWTTSGPLVLQAVKEFFTSGELLKESNSTILALIPKVPNPSRMGDFRPISCCNTIYKCISKLISKKLQLILPFIVDPSQSAFIKGRKISDNILLAQDLLRDYHKPGGAPRVAAKVDLMKAYDSVRWEFLFDLLDVLEFPPKIKIWIRACVSSPKYSINFNGESVGYFAGTKGLRQGDPMSPYLFVLIMDTLSQLIHYNMRVQPRFRYHWRCNKLNISHLCFADDLLLLFYGDAFSAHIMKASLDQFYKFTGLLANTDKSCVLLAGVAEEASETICNILQFNQGSLPLKVKL